MIIHSTKRPGNSSYGQMKLRILKFRINHSIMKLWFRPPTPREISF